MAKQEKSSKTGFIIKLSTETVQKLTEEQSTKSKGEQQPTNASGGKSDKNISEVKPKPSHESQPSVKDSATDVLPFLRSPSPQHKSDAAGISSSACSATGWGDYAPHVSYEGELAVYTDPASRRQYTWDADAGSWKPREAPDVTDRVYSYEDDTHIYTEPDGSKCFWDVEKKAWIPKVDDDFLAYYQMSYGFIDNTAKEPKEEAKKEDNQKVNPQGGLKRKSEPQWFHPSEETNTKVYVSNLPEDLTEEEFVNLMQKCGLVERDVSTQKMKVKLYMDKEQNCFKGDALCTYIKIESVDLALKLLDGSDYKGNKIKVERAHFQLKGEYNPALKPKKKRKKELEKIKKMQQKLFDWRPEKFVGERSKHERVVIVKNLFHPSDFDKEVQLILDYQQDLREECTKCGDVRKVVIYDRHPEGVAQITMKEPEQADAVVQLIHGRWFGKRQITAEIWDGRTKYRIAETDADISKRIEKWDKFLEGKEAEDKNKLCEIATAAVTDPSNEGTKEEAGFPVLGSNEGTKEEAGSPVLVPNQGTKEEAGSPVLVPNQGTKKEVDSPVVESNQETKEEVGFQVLASNQGTKKEVDSPVAESNQDTKEEVGFQVLASNQGIEEAGSQAQ